MDANQIKVPLFYLAPISYYGLIFNNIAHFSNAGMFMRKSYLHRGFISSSSGTQELIIPLCKHKEDSYFEDIRISNYNKCQKNHWRSIKTNYNSSPYFQFYQDDFERIYKTDYHFLTDINRSMNQVICTCLSMSFQTSENPFNTGLLTRDFWKMELPEYHQVFEKEHGFISGLSILDLLFNLGPESRIYLQKISPLPQNRITTFEP
jgi:hypothetical protein